MLQNFCFFVIISIIVTVIIIGYFMRYSKQRELIYNTLKNNPCHPTADYLYSLIKPLYPPLSLGTLYRNLNQMAEQGRIKKISGLNQADHFDHIVQEHAHIICEVCGKVEDVFIDENLSKQINETADKTNFKINHREIVFNGICSKCRNKQEK